MKKVHMRSRSESLQGQVIKSEWAGPFKQEAFAYRVNIRKRKVIKPDGGINFKTDYTILLDEMPPTEVKLQRTDFGLVCVNCKTSEYLQDQWTGTNQWNKEYAGCTCTRCGSATLKQRELSSAVRIK